MSKIRNYIHTPYLAKWNEKYFQLLEFGETILYHYFSAAKTHNFSTSIKYSILLNARRKIAARVLKGQQPNSGFLQ